MTKKNERNREKAYKKENELLIHQIDVRYSEEQLSQLNQMRQTIPLRTYIRKQSLKGRIIKKERTQLEKELISQLRRIGVNLNQITKQINIFKENAQIDNYMIEIRSYLEELRERLKKL